MHACVYLCVCKSMSVWVFACVCGVYMCMCIYMSMCDVCICLWNVLCASMFVCTCVCTFAHACDLINVGVREQFAEVSYFLLPCDYRG